MGDFLGSYFAEGDETQLTQDIEVYGKEQPATIVNFKELERDASEKVKWDAIDESLEVDGDGADEDFSPVAVASMNSFDPASMVGIPLTRKAKTLSIKREKDGTRAETQFKKALSRLKQISAEKDGQLPISVLENAVGNKNSKTGKTETVSK